MNANDKLPALLEAVGADFAVLVREHPRINELHQRVRDHLRYRGQRQAKQFSQRAGGDFRKRRGRLGQQVVEHF